MDVRYRRKEEDAVSAALGIVFAVIITALLIIGILAFSALQWRWSGAAEAWRNYTAEVCAQVDGVYRNVRGPDLCVGRDGKLHSFDVLSSRVPRPEVLQ